MGKITSEISESLEKLRETINIRGYCNIVREYLYNEMQIEVTPNMIYKVVGGHVRNNDIEKALWIYINNTAPSLQQDLLEVKGNAQKKLGIAGK